MSNLTLLQAMSSLVIDPLPNAQCRELIKYLARIKDLLIQTSKSEHETKVKIGPINNEQFDQTKFLKVNTRAARRILLEFGIEQKLVTLLPMILKFLVYKVVNCNNAKARDILMDLREMVDIIGGLKGKSLGGANMNEIMHQFIAKVLDVMEETKTSLSDERYLIGSLCCVILEQLGKHCHYDDVILKTIARKITTHYELNSQTLNANRQYTFCDEYHIMLQLFNHKFNERTSLDSYDTFKLCKDMLTNSSIERSVAEDYIVKNIMTIIHSVSYVKLF